MTKKRFQSSIDVLRKHAAKRSASSIEHIDEMNLSIAKHRNKQINLTDITADSDRLAKRIAREKASSNHTTALERINGATDFQDIHIIEQIVKSAESVCRISIRTNSTIEGYGSGFLIAPNILLTNNHVLPTAKVAMNSLAEFNYELNKHKHPEQSVTFKLNPNKLFVTSDYQQHHGDPFSGLDFTLVWVDSASISGQEKLERFGHIKLNGNLGKILEGESCVIIQHPEGDYKKIVLKDIRMISLLDDFILYESDTSKGSSGSVVLGLGTGEAVGLHHCAVPKMDNQGNWLRKDGSIAADNDPDHLIDWIGNEGVRISRILHALQHMNMPQTMRDIIEKHILTSPMPSHTLVEQARPKPTTNMLHFEIILAENLFSDEDIETVLHQSIPNLVDCEELFPATGVDSIHNLFYLTINSTENPWELAEQLEKIPCIEQCIPDLPAKTDLGQKISANRNTQEASLDIIDDGRTTWNEDEFIEEWSSSNWFKAAKKVNNTYYRFWNWEAINMPQDKKRNTNTWKKIKQNLSKLRLVQLDTGYTAHSKNARGYDLEKDFDFIDTDHNAKDEYNKSILKFPGHGTRTASVLIGGRLLNDLRNIDGNQGLLNFNGKPKAKIIPYRIADSVILLNRGKELQRAVKRAITLEVDVMFMCMGSYPRPMIEASAREAYDNGIIWVCAAGNEVEAVVAPAMYPGTIAVAAINPNDEPWKGSSHGPMVDIAAPGEQVYVPTINQKDYAEIMSYGNGTSYATPHVASAAMLWKALYLEELKDFEPWQVVEAFRQSLIKTARIPDNWNSEEYGKGVLDISALLKEKPPTNPNNLVHAYQNKEMLKRWDKGVREVVHFFWNIGKEKVKRWFSGESINTSELSERGKIALEMLRKSKHSISRHESAQESEQDPSEIIKYFFNNQ